LYSFLGVELRTASDLSSSLMLFLKSIAARELLPVQESSWVCIARAPHDPALNPQKVMIGMFTLSVRFALDEPTQSMRGSPDSPSHCT
jgi:hypothetical protein